MWGNFILKYVLNKLVQVEYIIQATDADKFHLDGKCVFPFFFSILAIPVVHKT